MVRRMRLVVDVSPSPQAGQELNNEERNLLSVAYKNTVGARRTAWRSVSAIEAKEKERVSHLTYQNSTHYSLVSDYRIKIENEL